MDPNPSAKALAICEPKRSYRKAERAQLMIDRMRENGLDRKRRLQVYLCRVCGRYHIGNRPKPYPWWLRKKRKPAAHA